MKASPDDIRQHFDGLVEHLSDLEEGQPAIVDAPLALELVARAASATTPDARRVLDVGCGAGNYSLKLLQHLPDLDVVLLDLSLSMLERAAERVGAATSGEVTTLEGDVRDVELGEERYDVVLAGAVLHHLRDEAEWEGVFAKLHATLRPGGWLWISDLVEHATPEVQGIMAQRYGRYLVEVGGEEFRDVVFTEIDEQDSPRPLLFQADLLREVGFGTVEVLHVNTRFATFGAMKPA